MRNIEMGGYYSSFYESAREAIEEFLPASKGEYSPDDITALQGLVKAYTQCSRAETNNIFCRVLSIVDGKKWGWKIIRGYCQSDWNEIFYPVDDWSREALAAFEIEYFNMGSEWIIDDGEFNPDTDSPPLILTGIAYMLRLRMKRALEKSLQPLKVVFLPIWFYMCLKVIPVFPNIRRCKCVYSFANLAFTGSNNS